MHQNKQSLHLMESQLANISRRERPPGL